ncbi:MAG: FecR family protein [Candidatus Acidiferrum sp.]
MKSVSLVFIFLFIASLSGLTTPPALADSSHARIVRLSLVQGDVRFTHEFHKDSMDDSKAVWEIAPMNLPIREGYAIGTDANGRAEVEFENGAMAFLSPNTVIEFYDLSLEDGARITRLILRQGSAIFYVHPAQDDYFSVTGGDFSVEANGRTRFRLDNYDDGSNVNVELGKISVLRNKTSKALEKGQSYSVNINNGGTPLVARSGEYDDFDKWVSGRIDSVATATTYTSQYVNSPDYTSGFADLYNYGSFYNVAGYGYGWQPYGAGFGWNPFGFGDWYFDTFYGWNFIGSAPWGWLPYHYGGWIFSPSYGWLWTPTGFGSGGPLSYHPITAVWVRNGTTTGLVPLNPADGHGKTPINVAHGIYAVRGNTLEATPTTTAAGEKWSVVKNPPRGTLSAASLEPATQPVRVSRTILSGNSGSRSITFSRDSSIVYDAAQHRFVNGNSTPKTVTEEAKESEAGSGTTGTAGRASVAGVPDRNTRVPTASHGANMPSRPHISPPSPPSSGYASHTSSNRAVWEGSAANPGTSMNSSHTSTAAPSGHSGGGHH